MEMKPKTWETLTRCFQILVPPLHSLTRESPQNLAQKRFTRYRKAEQHIGRKRSSGKTLQAFFECSAALQVSPALCYAVAPSVEIRPHSFVSMMAPFLVTFNVRTGICRCGVKQ